MCETGVLSTGKIEIKRDTNIELFRIISMLMIVMTHFLTHGGALSESQMNSTTYIYSWFANAFCVVAVNCYVLISGYFLVNHKFSVKRIIIIWAQILFYSILVSSVLWATGVVNLSLKDIANTVLPVLTSKYWFATTYIALYLFSPFLNKVIKALSQKQMKVLILLMITVFSVWPTFVPFATTLDRDKGNSIAWFVTLYFVAAYIRLFYTPGKRKMRYLAVYVCVSIAVFLSKLMLDYISSKIGVGTGYSAMFYNYSSLTILISSVSLFLFVIHFSGEFKRFNKIILAFSSATFGVYLIHDNSLFRPVLWDKLINVNALFDSRLFILESLLIVFSIYIASSLIEIGRKKLFSRLENCSPINKISAKFDRLFNKE